MRIVRVSPGLTWRACKGVAAALLAQAFAVLHERGQGQVTAEIDDTNTAAFTLLGGMGARRTSGIVEFVKRL